jgi:putative ABC transport system ATP-binding protein
MGTLIAAQLPALDAQDLYRFFRAGDEETLALRGVSVNVNAGEIVAVTGPSGSGKSTLLACLAGLDEPAGGTVFLSGARMSHRPESERALLRSRQIGVLFQSSNLLGHLTVAENIALVQKIAKSATRAPREILDTVGLGGRATALPSQLSGGEAARAGLAVALANDPAVLLADEPTGELDGFTEGRLLDLLRDRADRGCAVLVVTHSPEVVLRADRAVGLRDGQVVS